MPMPETKYLKDIVLITCVVERGRADDVMDAARKAGAPAATIFYARGTGVRERLGLLGIAIQAEKEVLQIVIPKKEADRIFDAVAEAAQVSLPGKGFIYMLDCIKAMTYFPKPEKKRAEKADKKPTTKGR